MVRLTRVATIYTGLRFLNSRMPRACQSEAQVLKLRILDPSPAKIGGDCLLRVGPDMADAGRQAG
jgi:hypothetical protein